MAHYGKISVILNVYRRSKNFPAQLDAILSQSIKPHEIFVWENGEEAVPEHLKKYVTITRSSVNLGVWARFAYALNAEGDFICVIDDDTIPGVHWFKNCIETMAQSPGLLGTRGLVFESPYNYSINTEYGVYGTNENTVQVDIVGHCWFFRREWLATYWLEYNSKFDNKLAGEDIHFSYALQKHLGIPTLVPPHRVSAPEEWGSDPSYARQLGEDKFAISKSAKAMKVFENALQHYRGLGFKILQELHNVHEKPISRYPSFVYLFAAKLPSLSHNLGRFKLIQLILKRIDKLK
jgi:glycosyltransferase involved in cell wall biosynthesis